jgi:hypothetical protein
MTFTGCTHAAADRAGSASPIENATPIASAQYAILMSGSSGSSKFIGAMIGSRGKSLKFNI